MHRRLVGLFLLLIVGLSGCQQADPEPLPESIPKIPPGRTMPSSEPGKSGGGSLMPAPPQP